MGSFFIYNAKTSDSKYYDITVVFNPDVNVDINSLRVELSEHFAAYHQTCALVFIHCSECSSVQQVISKNLETIFKSIPRVEEDSLKESIFYVSYNKSSFKTNKRFLERNIKEILNQGLASIFVNNGGLVESNGVSHHYVFPSGKHSAKFLRTANVLVRKAEIDFIAINTLHLFPNKEIRNIYCDTLSINVIGYALLHYLRRYDNTTGINISSFKSYNGIYDKEASFANDAIFLISASTSGGLVHYLKSNHPELDSSSIAVLYYLPIDKDSSLSRERVLCNLELNTSYGYGIDTSDYLQYKTSQLCKYCQNQSSPIKILGDSFSLDEPIINTRNVNAKKYITTSLKEFVQLFKYNKDAGNSLKVSFSEDSIYRKKYSLYIDYENIIKNIESPHFKRHKDKIDAYVNQFVPASTRYIIHLNDKGSLELANYINSKLSPLSTSAVKVVNHADLPEENIPTSESGAILIVASCITNGKNLLYLSRFFRNHDNIRLVYFIGINRINSWERQKDLKSNLKYGLYGPENSSFIEIETINCDNSSNNTPWEYELDFLKKLQSNLNSPLQFVQDRIKNISSFSSAKDKGGADKIFYSDFAGYELEIRKNSAFFDNNDYFKNISQSDVFFTISCVLVNMRNNKVDGLFQTSFVRNLLDPYIFNRFNDGIIQASILRAAKNEELNYSFSYDNSEIMLMILKTLIKHKDEYQGEAILEFLYSLSTGKMRLHKSHYQPLIDDLNEIDDVRIKLFKGQIEDRFKQSL